jgi:hypothetical protein
MLVLIELDPYDEQKQMTSESDYPGGEMWQRGVQSAVEL